MHTRCLRLLLWCRPVFSQTVGTTSGASHTLAFQYGAFGSAGKSQRILVEVISGGTPLVSALLTAYGPGNFLAPGTTFQPYALPFIANSTSVVIRFTDQTTSTNSNTCDGMLDAISISAEPLPGFAAWRSAQWPGVSDPAIIAGEANPDSDGFQNLLEYALGLDPKIPDGFNAVVQGINGEHLSLNFYRLAKPDITYLVTGSFDLVGWDLLWESSGAENTEGPVTVVDEQPIPATGGRFLRLEVSQ